MDLSIIVPLYNEEDSVNELTERIVKVLKERNSSYEICFVEIRQLVVREDLTPFFY